ncbi:MAG: tyrosine-type recombinase/integrase [Peptococcaceae bacterium]|nr:tyrosine-type recombinase/integrase [Peptococcaceae bacterium]
MNKRSFRFKRKTADVIPYSVQCSDIDFNYALDIFKDEYMRDDWSQRTLNFHLENLAIFKKYLDTQSMSLGQISQDVLDDYIKSMRTAGKKKNTINGRIKTLRVFFRVLNKKGYIPNNPALSLETIRGPQVDIRPFSDDQIKALLSQPDRTTFVGLRDYMVMQLLLDTGIRLEELCNVIVSDVDLKSCSIYIRQGKGRKSRTVFFGAETRKSVIKYLTFTGIASDGDTNLVLNQDGQPLKPRSIQERISIYAIAAGIKGVRPSPHTFRHTFAKMYLMNGGDPYALRDLLGHNTMSTVILYLKLFREDLYVKYRGKSPVDNLTHKKDDT